LRFCLGDVFGKNKVVGKRFILDFHVLLILLQLRKWCVNGTILESPRTLGDSYSTYSTAY
jgi:hypothetical protein